MTTSGTTSFNLELDELFDEAYGRVGIGGTRSGFHLRAARRNLNILLSEWDNRGVHLWKVKLATIPLVLGQAEYSFTTDPTNYPNDINDVLEAYIRNNTSPNASQPTDTSLTKIVELPAVDSNGLKANSTTDNGSTRSGRALSNPCGSLPGTFGSN